MTLVGPTEAGLSRAKDRFRYILYVKCNDEASIQYVRQEVEKISRETKWEKLCSVQLDRNPMAGY